MDDVTISVIGDERDGFVPVRILFRHDGKCAFVDGYVAPDLMSDAPALGKFADIAIRGWKTRHAKA
jgi:hypothetical protein